MDFADRTRATASVICLIVKILLGLSTAQFQVEMNSHFPKIPLFIYLFFKIKSVLCLYLGKE